MAMLSIMGLYNYDNTLFDNLAVPEGVDRETVIDNILLETAELEVVYSNFDFLKAIIGRWSKTMEYRWNTLFKTTTLEYNPIWNKDGVITETETVGRETTGSGNNDTTTQLGVAAYNSSAFENSEKTTGHGEFESVAKDDTDRDWRRTEQGNIGITTTQQMIKEEREVAGFSIYDIIASDFKQKFCILVY